MKKLMPERQYTGEFREAAVSQVLEGGRSIRQVARSLEMSSSTLGKWVAQARKGQALSSRSARVPVGEMEAEVSRLRQEVARLKVEKEILKNRLRRTPRPMWVETRGYFYTEAARRQ